MSDAPPGAGAIWGLLGIAPTNDQKSIRRAYALALKAIDVEADPKAFVALREAYDTVRTRDPIRPASLAESAPAAATRTAEAAGQGSESAIRAIAGQIVALLDADTPIAAIEEPLGDLTLRLIAQAEMATVDVQDDAEEWLVATIADNVPRSDAMIRPANAQYRWHLRRYGERRPSRASILIDRLRDLSFAELHVLREGGRHHQAYLALQAMPVQGFMRRPDIAALASLPPFFRETGDDPRVATVTFDEEIVEAWHQAVRRHHLAIDHWHDAQRKGWSSKVQIAMSILIILITTGAAVALFYLQSRGSNGVGATPPSR